MASRLVRPVLILLLTASAVTSLAVSTASAPPPLSDVGRWSEPFEGGVPAVNMILLHDGSVLYYSGNEGGDQDWVYFLNATLEGQAR
ncbi:MAG TPA: hypothetical protein VI997_00275, partial [Candidatus Thermoplasmatota archaeon]|nr:hypothetical protein [Candidatus Thermoplasmatota archaeon]